jgi:glutamate--cysteine ligase
VATALFANSPFTEGKPNGFLSFRSEIWRDTDNARAGMLPWAFESGMGFERWVDYALDVPMYFVKRGDEYIDVSGSSFRAFFEGRNNRLPGQRPTLSDWANHLSTIFPEVRLKRYLEMRGADGVPWERLPALPAFWVGLLYDDVSLDAAWDLCRRCAMTCRGSASRRGSRTATCSRSPRNASGLRMRACAGAAMSIISAATRAVIWSRWTAPSIADTRRPRRCWQNSTAPGTVRWNRHTRNMRSRSGR